MANKQITDYIAAQFVAGYTEQQIREALAAKKWPQAEIDEAFAAWKSNPSLPDRKEIGTFIKETWGLYKQLAPKYFEILKVLAISFLKYFLPGLAAMIIVFILMNSGDRTANGFNDLGTPLGLVAGIAFIGYFILFIYYSIWLSVAFLHVVRGRNSGVTTLSAIDMGKPQIGSYFWTSLLGGLLTFLWALLFIIPGIIMGVYYALGTYIVVDKNISGMDALRKSKEYLKGMWWQFVFSILALGLVIAGMYIFDAILRGILTLTIPDYAPYVYSIVSMVINFIFAPFPIIYMYLIYERVKALKPEVL